MDALAKHKWLLLGGAALFVGVLVISARGGSSGSSAVASQGAADATNVSLAQLTTAQNIATLQQQEHLQGFNLQAEVATILGALSYSSHIADNNAALAAQHTNVIGGIVQSKVTTDALLQEDRLNAQLKLALAPLDASTATSLAQISSNTTTQVANISAANAQALASINASAAEAMTALRTGQAVPGSSNSDLQSAGQAAELAASLAALFF